MLIASFTGVVLNPLLWLWLLLALLLWRMTRHNRRAQATAGLVLAVLWLAGTRPAADLLIAPLERRYDTPAVETLRARGIRQVVVLTGGGFPIQDGLLSSGLPQDSGVRFMAGLELCRQLGPGCRLVFTGSAGRGHEDRPTASVMEGLARAYSPEVEVVSESRSTTTAEHPVNVKPLVGREPFILLTSAYHMPRAMLAFEKAGLAAVPFPVDRSAFGDYDAFSLLPCPDNLGTIQTALHEYVGLAWYELTVHY